MRATQPSAEQVGALRRFAKLHGRMWKGQLRLCWESAYYPGASTRDATLLQQVRNLHGPSWLVRWKFPEEPTGESDADDGRAERGQVRVGRRPVAE
jgi:hypothetical protein